MWSKNTMNCMNYLMISPSCCMNYLMISPSYCKNYLMLSASCCELFENIAVRIYTSWFTRPDTRFTEKLRGVKFNKVYMDVYMKIYTFKFTRPTTDARGTCIRMVCIR
jgi:hypothetical protein